METYKLWIILILGLAVSLFVTPFIRLFAIRINALDRPLERKIHQQPLPTCGGLAIYFAFLISLLVCPIYFSQILGILVAATLILLIGFYDDRWQLAPWHKLTGQILSCALLLLFGIRIEFLNNPFNQSVIVLGWASYPLTIIWIIAVTNAMNLIDGLDGLAAGICAIAAFSLLMIAVREARVLPALLSAGLCGSCLGFLRYNFYPASIFMGDTGSQFCGFLLSVIAIIGALKSAAALAIFSPVLILALPLLDTLLAIFRRLKRGLPMFQADKEHIHHRLLEYGLTQRQVVFIFYLVTIICCWLAILITSH